MVVEIRFSRAEIRVRRFGSLRDGWAAVTPGGADASLTGYTYEQLRKLGEGVWDVPGRGEVA